MGTFISIIAPVVLVVILLAHRLRSIQKTHVIEITETTLVNSFHYHDISSVTAEKKEDLTTKAKDELWEATRSFDKLYSALVAGKEIEDGAILNNMVRMIKLVHFLMCAYDGKVAFRDPETKELKKWHDD